MNIVGRLILTVLAALVGVVCGGLIGSYGLFFLCELIDWMRDAGPGNKIGGGAWALMIVTVPGCAFYLGVAFGTGTWHHFSKNDAGSEISSDLNKRRQPQSGEESIEGFLSDLDYRDRRFDDD